MKYPVITEEFEELFMEWHIVNMGRREDTERDLSILISGNEFRYIAVGDRTYTGAREIQRLNIRKLSYEVAQNNKRIFLVFKDGMRIRFLPNNYVRAPQGKYGTKEYNERIARAEYRNRNFEYNARQKIYPRQWRLENDIHWAYLKYFAKYPTTMWGKR